MQPPDTDILNIMPNQSARPGECGRPARLRRLIWLPMAVGFYLSAATGFAATITWGAATTISADPDVYTNGAALYAYTGGTAATVNGVTFTAGNSGAAWGGISLSGFGTDNQTAFGSGTGSPWSTLSTVYKTVLSGGAYGGASAGTVTLNGLTSGHEYAVQIWANDNRGGGEATRNEIASSTGGNTVTLAYEANQASGGGGVGQYALGTFVANSASQTFTLTPSASGSVQLNGINVRDTGVYVYTPTPFTATRVNLAKYQTVITDSTTGTQGGQYITDGLTFNDDYWQSGPSGTHWAQVVFPFPVTVGSVQLVMGRDTVSPPTVFWLQYLTNSTWVTVPGTTVVGNTNKEVNLVFNTPITASSFRFYDSIDGNIYLREMAIYPPNGSNGYPFGTDFGVDLARKQPVFATAILPGNYPLLAVDGRISPSSAWQTTLVGSNSLLVNLQFTNKIGSAHLYSGATGVAPLSNFILQYWNGGAWQNIPGGSVTGNTNAALVIPFTTPVTTTEVQLLFTNASVSAVQELCIFSADNSYPLGTGVITNSPITARYGTFLDSYYYLSNAVAGQAVLESNGVPVLGQSASSNYLGQYQVLLNYDNGTYRLRNRNTGLCLAGAQLTTNAGAPLLDEPYSALPDQDWYLQSIDGFNFYLVNQFSGLAVDTPGGGTAPGTPLVQNVLTNSPSQYWQMALAAGFPKKCIIGQSTNSIAAFRASSTDSYGLGGGSEPTNVVNYDMVEKPYGSFTGNFSANLITFYQSWRTNSQSFILIGYNEPDGGQPYDPDPTNGAIDWMNINNLDMPLAAPACASWADYWNPEFYGLITNWGLRVDYFPIHTYPNPDGGNSDCWISTCQQAYNTYGVPIWLHEFGCVDWSGTNDGATWSEEDMYTSLAEFVWRAESLPWLQKHNLFTGQADVADPMAPTPWWVNTSYVTPPPNSSSYDTNGNITPLGECYAGWDDDANMETNKIYYVFNSSARKRLSNTLGSALPNAQSILMRDNSVRWMLVNAGSANLYYLVSAADGRRLSYNGTLLSLVAPGTTGTADQWSLSQYQYGWYYLQHPATGKELSLAYNNSTYTATYSMVANTTTGTAVEWRFIVPAPPIVWTGASNNSISTFGNWSPASIPTEGQPLLFNSQSASNLSIALSANSSASTITLTTPAGPVSIRGTNTLTVGSGIDLSGASQDLTITAPLMLGGSQPVFMNFTVTNAHTLNVNGPVSDFGNVTLNIVGGGTVSLSGTNNYSGSTTIAASTLTISGAGQLGGGSYAQAITDNGAFNYNSSSRLTLSGIISGSGSVMVNGPGTLTLSGANTYSGSSTISGGTLALSGSGSLASPNIIVAGGAKLDVSGKTPTFVLSGSATLTNSSVGAVLSGNNNCSVGTLSLVMDGVHPSFIQTNGTMTLSASTVVTVNNLGATLTTGTYPLISAATAGNLGNVTGTLPSVAVTGSGALSTAALQIDGSGNLNLVIGGNIQAWIGASDNFWTTPGNWLTGVSPGAGGPVIFDSSSTANLATVLNADFGISALTVFNPPGGVSIGGANTLAITNGITMSYASQNLTLTAPVVLGGNQTWTVTNTHTLSANGGVSGSAGLTVTGGGTVSLGGTNTYTGATTINAGALTIGGAGELGGGNYSANIPNNTVLNYNSSATQTLSGIISGAGSVTENGSGMLTLSGANTYTGGTTISNGTLQLLYPTAVTTSGYLVNSNATLFINNNNNAWQPAFPPITLNGGTLTNYIANTAGTYGNWTGIEDGAVTVTAASAIGVFATAGGAGWQGLYFDAGVQGGAPLTIQSGANTVGVVLRNGNSAYSGQMTVNGVASTTYNVGSGLAFGPGGLTNADITVNGTLELGNATGSQGEVDYATSGSTFWMDALAGTGVVTADFSAASTRTLSVGNHNGSGTFMGIIANGADDTLSLVKNGTGTQTLSGVNTYTGATTINAGTLTISGAGQLNSGAYTATITNNGALNYHSSASQTLSGIVSGTGSLTQNGSGALTLSGANNYTGSTTISGGRLALSGSGSLASPSIIVAGGAAFDVSGETTTFALGSGVTLTNSSVGAVISGTNNCSAGTLSLVYDGINPSFLQTNGTMTLAASTVIKVNNSGAILATGNHTIMAAATAGNAGQVTGTLPSVVVTGNGAMAAVSLQINGTGGLDLVVASTTPPQAVIKSVVLSSGNLILQGTNGVSSGTYSILTSTNVALPLAGWTTNTTGSFTPGGAFSNAIPVTTQAQSFFLIKQP